MLPLLLALGVAGVFKFPFLLRNPLGGQISRFRFKFPFAQISRFAFKFPFAQISRFAFKFPFGHFSRFIIGI